MLLGAGGGGPRITYTGRYTGASSSPSTISSVDIGAADANRVVCVAISLYATGYGNPTITGVTIGGVTATIHRFFVDISGSKSELAFAYASVPTGTSASVVVTWTGSASAGPVIGAYRIITTSPTAADFDSIENGNPGHSITLTGGGVGIWLSGGYAAGFSYSTATNASNDGNGAYSDRQQYYGTITDPVSQFTITMSGSATTWELGGICWV